MVSPDTSTAVEVTVLEPGTPLAPEAPSEASDATMEASTSGQRDDAEQAELGYPEVPAGTAKAAELQYLGLGLAHLAAAGLAAFSALSAPQLLLPPAAASDPWATCMLGCLAATYLRAAGVFLHLRAAAIHGELLCWRHQRLAAGAALWSVVAAATQAFGAASLQLAGLQLLLAASSCALLLSVARSVARVAPLVSWLVWDADGSLWGLAAGLAREAWNAVTTVAGVLLLLFAGLSLHGFAHTALAPAPSPPPLLGDWPGLPSLGLAGWGVGLRRLVGAGLLLAAAQAAALLDFAGFVRRAEAAGGLEAVKRGLLQYLTYTRDRMAKYYMPHPATFTSLNASFLAAAALQAAFVAAAPAAGVNVNWDGPLWGPLYYTWVLGLLYGASVLFTFDWSAVGAAVSAAVGWATGLVLGFFDAFVWKFQWAERVRRR